MAKPTLNTVLTLLKNHEPLLSHQYVLTGIRLPFSSRILTTEFFQTRVESIDIPFRAFNAEDRHVESTKRSYAGFNQFNGFNMTFYEDETMTSLKGINEWQSQICNSRGEYKPAAYYWATMGVSFLNSKNKIIYTGKMIGVFPTQVNQITMTGSEVSRISLQVTFSVNKVIWAP